MTDAIDPAAPLRFLAGGGAMGALMRGYDWRTSPVGPPGSWPQGLRTAVRLILDCAQPMSIVWGQAAVCFYNDAYRAVLGAERHPAALGRPAREVWDEIWASIGWQLDQVMGGRGSTWNENQLFQTTRHGVREDVYWTYGCSPIDETSAPNGIGGVLVVLTETTGSMRALAALQASDDRLHRALTAANGIGTWEWDVPHDRVIADAPFCRLYGVDPQVGAAGTPIATFFGAVPTRDLVDLREAIAVALRTGDLFRAEYRLVQPDGSTRWVTAQGRCTLGPDGEPLRFPGVSFDITDRKATETELRALNTALTTYADERRRAHDQLWEMSEDLLVVADFDGHILKRSPSWDRLVGATAGAPADDRYVDIAHADDRPTLLASLERMRVDRQSVSVEHRLKADDGSWRWFAWRLSPEPSGSCFTGIGRDITDARAREATLRDQEDFTRLALSAVSGVGVWTFDAASDRFFCDRAISDLYGIDPVRGEAGIPRADFLANVDPADRAQLTTTMQGGLTHGGDIELEYRIRHPDGSVRWVMSRGHTYMDQNGKAVRRTGIGIETTRQRALEDQLRQSQKMEAVGQLTGGVAHDFNNLLTVIRSSIDLLKRPNMAEDRRQRYIEAISDTTTRAAKLTGQLLAFARRQTLKPEVFDAAEGVRSLGDMVGTLTGSRIAVETRVPDQPCFVNADASQFDTALVNLAANARDAMNGTGKLSIAVRIAGTIPPLRSHAAVAGDFVVVSVSDTGSGIAPDDIDHIFEPFFTTKGVGHGTGLGLSQVFGFVKQSGGEVAVESLPGQGATFSLYLPRVAAKVPKPEPEPDLPLADGHGICVLVVEDNVDVGAFSAQTLRELGYRPVLAVDAQAALAELATDAGRFDVVFSDVEMPGMNGVDLAREIQRQHRDLPVVLTSGYSHVLAEHGTYGFELLQKPYSVEQLSRLLQKAAYRRRLKRMLND